ncbi:MAG: CusA/CzcA family heavy metal efflux RND transporter [Legionellaceae bacterium]|uniref:Cation efflux system protein cusA n=1 Tax=Legionella spiritensis TaxID=452 RepID=A0A0W0YZ53_LEGSP|nr:efflux RND transporter permease subunit [Legionella spiritensis]KTD62197.1 Cation efflux system protein cusA [Legionella spiritensis]MBJ15896.1 CusA/CzcA family heavy metal efflux RND transporter [Legionellaceae bacterium]SNV29246.1 Cation efflux system protein cusA [Legionella spiritensis]HCA90194.1 CusA/CzcA family heavy metal efflux RND transporter [Legionellales bacterium]|tara:strand:- start:1863 stop:4979 length:3117 start_codon:yes stop_codon:yes gene_type:complete
MIGKIIGWSIDNRFLVVILSALLFAIGIITIKNTPVDAIPDLSDVQVIIKTPYPGQAPQVVELQVTYPLATAMLAVPGATTVRGYSFFGDSYIYVLFKDGTDLYWARSRVLEYLNQVAGQLPPQAKPQLGPDATGVGWVYEYALVDKTGKHDLGALTTLQNWFLKYELQTVPGVSEVATIGGMVKQYQVIADPNKLRSYNLTLSKVKQAIQDANQEVGGSVIEMGEGEYMVRAMGYLDAVNKFKNIPLGVTSKGIPILLHNVAKIRTGPQLRRGVAELNGKGEVVGGIVVMRMGDNAREVIQNVKTKLKQLAKSLPKGVEIVTTYDRASLIERAIDTLKQKLTEEIIAVIIVCFLFLYHFRSSLIVVISLPLSILIAFITMSMQGINANIMSLGGIAIAIGVMVDAAIVMIENAHKHLEKIKPTEETRWNVIKEAAIEVGPALFFSLLIITLSFVPVFTLQAQEGKLFAPLAFTKTYAMAASAFVSITLVPVLMGYFIRGKITPESKNPLNRLLIVLYRPLINFTLKFPKTILLILLAVLIISYYPLQKLGSEFMPELDEGDWMYMPSSLPGISIGKARQVLQQTDKLIMQVPEVETVFGKVGRAQTATDPAPLNMIETIIQFKPKSEWRKGMTREKLKQEMNEVVKLPGITNAWVMPIKGRIDMLATGIKTPVGIKILGPKLGEIQKIGKQLEEIIKQIPGTASVYADRVVGGRYINVDIDRRAAARYGLNIKDVHQIITSAIGGMDISESIEGRERYPINLRYPQLWRDSANKLKTLPIVTVNGPQITLGDIAKVTVDDGPPIIKSENAQLNGWVLVDLNTTDIGDYVSRAQKIIDKKLKMPPGYSLYWSGQYEYMERAKERLKFVGPLTLFIIMLLLYIHFRRLPEVFLVMGTLPLALVGSVWLLYLLNYNLSIAVAVGMIGLAGIAVEIGVVMLVYLNHALRDIVKEHKKLNEAHVKQAVINGALLRVRPIIMTVSSTVIGLLPIMVGTGTGSEVMRRIAAPMVGGMISATLLTLFVIPAVFYLWKKHALIKGN